MAQLRLSAVKTGITRLRLKGGASPDSLADLANAYVTAARTIAPRVGSRPRNGGLGGTHGLALLNGVFQVFSAPGGPAAPDAGVRVNIITHPDPLSTADIRRIWKAEALMGGLYVVAEWDDNPDIAYHYWIRSGPAWQPNYVYALGAITEPGVANGLSYTASRLTPQGTLWTANTELVVGDVIEPNTFNGYEYEVMETYGAPARTGATEPAWIALDGAIVVEEADLAPPATGGGTTPTVPPGYENPGGSLPPTYSDTDDRAIQ